METTSDSNPGRVRDAGLSLQGRVRQCCTPMSSHNAGSSLLQEGVSRHCNPLQISGGVGGHLYPPTVKPSVRGICPRPHTTVSPSFPLILFNLVGRNTRTDIAYCCHEGPAFRSSPEATASAAPRPCGPLLRGVPAGSERRKRPPQSGEKEGCQRERPGKGLPPPVAATQSAKALLFPPGPAHLPSGRRFFSIPHRTRRRYSAGMLSTAGPGPARPPPPLRPPVELRRGACPSKASPVTAATAAAAATPPWTAGLDPPLLTAPVLRALFPGFRRTERRE